MSTHTGGIADLPLKNLGPFGGITPYQGKPMAHTCPHCGKGGTFECPQEWAYSVGFEDGDGKYSTQVSCSVRFCPNPKCNGPVFLVVNHDNILHALPPSKIDFDTTSLPQQIADCLEEAIGCHAARCYRASALLVRRTIEEVCKDKSASGNNLKARIRNLGTVMTMPPALIAAMDQLRLLGNDAAHVDAADYDDIGANEAAAAIMLAKEIVKAAYQYDSLLEALSNLRRDASP